MSVAMNQQTIQVKTGEQRAVPGPAEIQGAIDRMTIRVNAFHAHRESLNRAALGLRWIHEQLILTDKQQAERRRWTPERLLVGLLLRDMSDQIDEVLAPDCAFSIDEQRSCLQSAVARAVEALVLLEYNIEARASA